MDTSPRGLLHLAVAAVVSVAALPAACAVVSLLRGFLARTHHFVVWPIHWSSLRCEGSLALLVVPLCILSSCLTVQRTQRGCWGWLCSVACCSTPAPPPPSSRNLHQPCIACSKRLDSWRHSATRASSRYAVHALGHWERPRHCEPPLSCCRRHCAVRVVIQASSSSTAAAAPVQFESTVVTASGTSNPVRWNGWGFKDTEFYFDNCKLGGCSGSGEAADADASSSVQTAMQQSTLCK